MEFVDFELEYGAPAPDDEILDYDAQMEAEMEAAAPAAASSSGLAAEPRRQSDATPKPPSQPPLRALAKADVK